VMHDGIVEQIGTPLELFDRPGNLFVAQFIGSPAMNTFEGTLRSEGGRRWVEAHGAQWPVPADGAGQQGQTVHYGIRPTDLRISSTGQGIPAKVVVVEPTGAETELVVDVDGMTMNLVMHGRTNAQPDEVIHLDIDPAKSHLFATGGGERIG
jgi:multiple sugar transport system ATP-binding protein